MNGERSHNGGGWFKVPNRLVEGGWLKILTEPQLKTWLVFELRAGADGVAFCGPDHVVACTAMDRRTAERSVSALVAYGLLVNVANEQRVGGRGKVARRHLRNCTTEELRTIRGILVAA